MTALDAWMTPWTWAAVAAGLAALEVVAPGTFMIWLALAAAGTAVATAITGIAWPAQMVVFAVLAGVVVVAGRRWMPLRPQASADPQLNRRAERLLGQRVTVCDAIVAGSGKVMIGDSPWLATGPDVPAGARVRIVGIDGATLAVTPADGG